MKNQEVNTINSKLIQQFGKTLDNKAKFRIIWSDEQFEYRTGTFNEFYKTLFLRTTKGVKQVPKYNYIKSRWILELYNSPIGDPNIMDYNGYEPLYVFENAHGNPLPPRLTVCQIIIQHFLTPMIAAEKKSIWESIDKKELQKDIDYFKDVIEEESPYISTMLHVGEAIIVPEIKEEKCSSKQSQNN